MSYATCAHSLEVFAGEEQQGNEAKELPAPPQWRERAKSGASFFSLRFAAQAHQAVHLDTHVPASTRI